MGRSLEYIKKRIEEGNCCNMPMEEFQDMCEIPLSHISWKIVEII